MINRCNEFFAQDSKRYRRTNCTLVPPPILGYRLTMASRVPPDQNLLADLVERRIEAPDVEYKNFMPLTENVERAKIARHICALANAGGGWLVFGFDDDGTPSHPHPGNLAPYGQDAINGIGAKYLEPQPHCEVHHVTAVSGLSYPVVRVPSHGAVPVCTKTDGPQDAKGRTQGISKGVHYVRAPGPKSVPIDSPDLWREVLRRCVMTDRTSLLTSIGQLFDRPQPTADSASPLLRQADWALERWTTAATEADVDWPVDVATNRVAFGFRLTDDAGNAPAPLSLPALAGALREASSASATMSRSGSGAFAHGNSGESKPGVILTEGRESYTARQSAKGAEYLLPAEWFVRDDGLGVEVAGLGEDNPWVSEVMAQRRSRPWPPGERLAPSFQIDMTAERVAFVAALAVHFPDATKCELIVDYAGLAGRRIDETAAGVYFSIERSSRENGRRVVIEIGIAALAAGLPEVVAALIGPVFRLYEWDVGADYVRKFLTGGRR